MKKALCSTSPLATIAALRKVPRVSNSYVFRRGVAFLGPDNDYLPKLLDKEGLSTFLKTTKQITDQVKPAGKESAPPETSRTLLAHFTIERTLICIRCALALTKSADYDPSPTMLNLNFPSYDPAVQPPSITKELSDHEFPTPSRISELTQTLWRVFCQNDLLTLHVEAKLYPDGSMSFSRCSANVDESAVHRQAELFSHITRDEHPDEIEAEKSLLVYRKFHGNIGTIVNGAGLAMATNDTIDLLHGANANFLDAGGKATPETIKEAFRLVLKNPKGDMIATGILQAMDALHITIPVVARIQGTNGSLGMQMLENSTFKNIYPEENLYSAVKRAVKISKRTTRQAAMRKDSYESDDDV